MNHDFHPLKADGEQMMRPRPIQQPYYSSTPGIAHNVKRALIVLLMLCCIVATIQLCIVPPPQNSVKREMPDYTQAAKDVNISSSKESSIHAIAINNNKYPSQDPPLQKQFHSSSVVAHADNEQDTKKVILPLQHHEHDSIDELFNQKKIKLQGSKMMIPAQEDCFCPNGRNNWIHYTGCPGGVGYNHGAGIKDRQNILRNIMWYADELCAKIALECTPEVWLSEEHGCFAPKDAQWDAYFTPVRLSSKHHDNLTASASFRVDVLRWNVSEATFKDLKSITSTQEKESSSMIQAYDLGRELYLKDIPFVWNFNQDFWRTDLYTPLHTWPHQDQVLNHRNYTNECGIIDLDTSEELLNIGQLALKELDIKYSNDFVTLHLRRGDYMECDTSPKTVMNYLNCSIAEDDVKKVIVLTNGETKYVKRLTARFSKMFPDKEIVMLDDFIESQPFVEKLNDKKLLSAHIGDKFGKDNCFRFSAEKTLVSMARYHLERGHAHCHSCDRGGSINENGGILI